MRRIIFHLVSLLVFVQIGKIKAESVFSSFSDNDSMEWVFKENFQFTKVEDLVQKDAFYLVLNQYEDSTWLYIKSDHAFYMFCGEQLIRKSVDHIIHMRVGELRNSQDGLLQISITPTENSQLIEYGYYKIRNLDVQSNNIQLVSFDRAISDPYKNTFLFIFLVLLVFLVAIKIGFQKRFEDIFSPTKIFTIRLNEAEQSRFRLFDQDNIIYSVLFTFITAAFIFLLLQETEYSLFGIYFMGTIGFLKLWIILSVLFISKVILIFVFSHLFGNPKISPYYVKEMLNINLFFLGLLFFSSTLIYLNMGEFPSYWPAIMKASFLIFFTIRLVLLYFKILKLSNFSKVYLFSYFCSTEIFPFIIGLKHFT